MLRLPSEVYLCRVLALHAYACLSIHMNENRFNVLLTHPHLSNLGFTCIHLLTRVQNYSVGAQLYMGSSFE